MTMRRLLPLIPFFFGAALAQGSDGRWSAGAEYFLWHEYIGSCPQALEERGPRVFLRYDDANQDNPDWELDWQGEVYGGLVVYDGFNQVCSPLLGTTGFFGASGEADAIRWLSAQSGWPRFGLGAGLGIDTWRRTLMVSGGYSEDYAIGSARLGLTAKRGEHWSAWAGIKQPFATYEVAHIAATGFSSDASLQPKGVLSYFAKLKYRFSAKANLAFYYDSYRFNPSDAVTIASCPPSSTSCLVHQPESHQDTFGFSWRLNL